MAQEIVNNRGVRLIHLDCLRFRGMRLSGDSHCRGVCISAAIRGVTSDAVFHRLASSHASTGFKNYDRKLYLLSINWLTTEKTIPVKVSRSKCAYKFKIVSTEVFPPHSIKVLLSPGRYFQKNPVKSQNPNLQSEADSCLQCKLWNVNINSQQGTIRKPLT